MRTNTSLLLYKCGILKFVDLIAYKTLIVMFKVKNNVLYSRVKWETHEVKQEAGCKKALYQQLAHISLDHNLEQVVNIPTRGENILDLMFTNNRSGLNKVSILPPLGKTDHDIIYADSKSLFI